MYRLALHETDLLSEAETAKLHGQYANQADYVYGPFDEDCTIVSPTAPGGIAARLLPRCLNTAPATIELFRTVKGELSNRGLGAPLLYRERPDGTYGHRTEVPRSVRVSGDSNFLGWWDKTDSAILCRPTAWSLERPDILEISRDFERTVHQVYKEELPFHWKDQMEFMKNVSPAFRYLNSVYSTITVNHNARFPYHYDFGDFAGGLGNLVVLDGSDDDNDSSGVMVMPTERVSFRVRPGDILFMNVHALHGNLALNGKERLTAVLYARENINKCH
jgi:hypothetical protein